MEVIKIGDRNYPKKLLNIYDPPKEIYVLGNSKILNDFCLGIVGTRKASEYGIKVTNAISYSLAKYGAVIVSGMANGIDTSAHKGAILAKGKTIAVLGGGFKHIYPKENEQLFLDIIKSGGAVITEYAEDIKPEKENFPKRNRIISGLSSGIIVTEAPEKSGSLITADLALEQGKDVFAIPGSIFSKNSKGTNELIKQGAKLTENIFDILEEFDLYNV